MTGSTRAGLRLCKTVREQFSTKRKRILVLVADDYSVIQACEQSMIPSAITRLQRSNLVNRSAER